MADPNTGLDAAGNFQRDRLRINCQEVSENLDDAYRMGDGAVAAGQLTIEVGTIIVGVSGRPGWPGGPFAGRPPVAYCAD